MQQKTDFQTAAQKPRTVAKYTCNFTVTVKVVKAIHKSIMISIEAKYKGG